MSNGKLQKGGIREQYSNQCLVILMVKCLQLQRQYGSHYQQETDNEWDIMLGQLSLCSDVLLNLRDLNLQ